MKSIYSEEYDLLISKMTSARHDAGISQSELSAKLGKPQSYVSKYERKERRLDVVEFLIIADHIGLDVNHCIDEIHAALRSRGGERG